MLQALVQFEQHSCPRFHPFGHMINYANRTSYTPYISEVALLEYNLHVFKFLTENLPDIRYI